jgi:hypothetical protein
MKKSGVTRVMRALPFWSAVLLLGPGFRLFQASVHNCRWYQGQMVRRQRLQEGFPTLERSAE